MSKVIFPLILFSLVLNACGQVGPKLQANQKKSQTHEEDRRINIDTKTIGARFNLPRDYERTKVDSASFADYLRHLPLKPDGALVTYFDGRTKPNDNVYDAVVDLPIGTRDLHQCADAVMRLRADYLFQAKDYDSIHFNFTNGFKADYANWRKGKRIVVNGNQVFWKQKTQPSDTERDFWKYLEMVFSYAGTASLSKELKTVSIEEMRIGDVFIKGGFPGHAVIVVDMAINKSTNDRVFLLAQSYMPAQEIQVLKNPNDPNLTPWYKLSNISTELRTPEWKFKKEALKRF